MTAGIAASVGTGLIYAAYNLVTINYVYPHFLDDMARAVAAMREARHLPAQSFETVRGELSASTIAVGNLVRLSVIGSVLSAIVALVLQVVYGRRIGHPTAAVT